MSQIIAWGIPFSNLNHTGLLTVTLSV